MGKNRLLTWVGGTSLLCVLLLLGTWFLLISPQRSQAADLQDQATMADQQNATLRASIEQLKTQQADLLTSEVELKSIRRQLPPSAQIPALVRDVDGIAKKAGVELKSLTPGAPNVLVPATGGAAATGSAADAAAAAGSTPAGSTPESTPAATSTPAPAAAAGADAAAGPVAPGTLVAIPVTMAITGEYFEAAVFVKRLQVGLSRAYLIDALDISTAEAPGQQQQAGGSVESGKVQMTVTGKVFVLTVAPEDESDGAAADASPSPSPTASATP